MKLRDKAYIDLISCFISEVIYMKYKSRQRKMVEYEEAYSDIPKDDIQRLNWLCDKLHIHTEKKYQEILTKRYNMIHNMYYSTYKVILYEEPEGTPRPRFRIINRQNLANAALSNGAFVQVYSLTGKSDKMYLNRLMKTEDFEVLNRIIYTPCDVEYVSFSKTPNYFNATDKILAEIGLIRPLTKPDWDNIGKKYSDMYTGNVWVDDTCVVRGVVDKYYSVLPRIEITIRFLNGLTNYHQYKAMRNKLDDGQSISYFDSTGNIKLGDPRYEQQI